MYRELIKLRIDYRLSQKLGGIKPVLIFQNLLRFLSCLIIFFKM